MNTFGNILRLTTAGESHGPALVGILDGFPPGFMIDLEGVDKFLSYRAPGHMPGVTSDRHEADHVEILSGMFEGRTTGTPIAFMIRNKDARPADYESLRHAYRPSHADYTYQMKYGLRDHRGGGRASARETALRVVAGSFALVALHELGVEVKAFTSQIGSIKYNCPISDVPLGEDMYDYSMRCPDRCINDRMEAFVRRVHDAGDTVGGVISCVISGLPPGIGEPVYGKLQSMLASAMFSINAVKGFEYGMGFDGAGCFGSEMNDSFFVGHDGAVSTMTNHSGGIQGGISNGADVYFRTAFKPIATLMRDIETIDDSGRQVVIPVRGRHDACAVPRAVPVVHTMAALAVLDAIMLHRSRQL